MKNLNLTSDSPQSVSGVWPSLISNSRMPNISTEKDSVTLPNTSKIDLILYKETAKIEKQKILMKNVMKNKIDQDRRTYELKEKLKKKKKKQDEALKLLMYDKQILKDKEDLKKM